MDEGQEATDDAEEEILEAEDLEGQELLIEGAPEGEEDLAMITKEEEREEPHISGCVSCGQKEHWRVIHSVQMSWQGRTNPIRRSPMHADSARSPFPLCDLFITFFTVMTTLASDTSGKTTSLAPKSSFSVVFVFFVVTTPRAAGG